MGCWSLLCFSFIIGGCSCCEGVWYGGLAGVRGGVNYYGVVDGV